MNFDGYVKHLGTIDVKIIEPISNMCNKIDWSNPIYTRTEYKLADGRLLEFPYLISKTEIYTKEQTRFIAECSVLVEHALLFFPDFVKVRGEIATLVPGAELTYHSDDHWFQKFCHRIHIPLITTIDCVQLWDNYSQHLDVGNIYEINNRKTHSARNAGIGIRTHLILDLCDPDIWYPFVNNSGNPLSIVKP
jgi:hypothetical protein